MNDNDIVERMRFWSQTRNNNPTAWNIDCAYASDTIDRLRAERDEIQRELRKAETESSILRVECGMIAAERDEARREVSVLRPCVCLGAQTAHEYAKQRGWDCFEITMCKEAQHDLEADTHPG